MRPESRALLLRLFSVGVFVIAVLLLFSRLFGIQPFGKPEFGIRDQESLAEKPAPVEQAPLGFELRRNSSAMVLSPSSGPWRRGEARLRFIRCTPPGLLDAELVISRDAGLVQLPRDPSRRELRVIARSPLRWSGIERRLFIRGMERLCRELRIRPQELQLRGLEAPIVAELLTWASPVDPEDSGRSRLPR